MPLLNLLQSRCLHGISVGRRYARLGACVAALLLVSLGLSACGKNFYFAGRVLPPSGILNRVMIAVQSAGRGQLVLVDGFYDIRQSFNNKVRSFPINGFSSNALPVSIQNLPAEQVGLVFSTSDGSLSAVNYQTEAARQLLPAPSANQIASSIFASSNLQYVIAAQEQTHYVEMYDANSSAAPFLLNLAGAYRTAINPGGTIALAFLRDQNAIYSVVHLTSAQQLAAINRPTTFQINGNTSEDCEPQNLPQYCIFPVDTSRAPVDHPIRAVFSPDGTSVYIINCGPECGGQTAGLTRILLPTSSLNIGAQGPVGSNLATSTFIPVPGGATDALFSGNTLYVAGQQLVPASGLFTGELSVVDTVTGAVSAPIPIADGTHQRMVLADDATLWIGSSACQGGDRFRQSQAGAATQYGCMSMVDTSNNTLRLIESYKGDGTGIAALSGLHKVYTAEGGQVYIYNTRTGAALDNANVAIQGTVIDVAYMDAPDDSDNTWY